MSRECRLVQVGDRLEEVDACLPPAGRPKRHGSRVTGVSGRPAKRHGRFAALELSPGLGRVGGESP